MRVRFKWHECSAVKLVVPRQKFGPRCYDHYRKHLPLLTFVLPMLSLASELFEIVRTIEILKQDFFLELVI